MNTSLDSSLLTSESIFIPLDKSFDTENLISEQSEIRTPDVFITEKENPPNEKERNEKETSTTEFSAEPIRMTQEEAMRLLHMAASLLQANIKRYLQQKHYIELITQKRAATKVQALWRGYRTRHLDLRVLKLKHEFLTKQFQYQVLSDQRNKQIFTEAIMALSLNVEKLNLVMTQQQQQQDKSKNTYQEMDGEEEDGINKVIDLSSDDDFQTNDEITDLKTDTIVLKDSLENIEDLKNYAVDSVDSDHSKVDSVVQEHLQGECDDVKSADSDNKSTTCSKMEKSPPPIDTEKIVVELESSDGEY